MTETVTPPIREGNPGRGRTYEAEIDLYALKPDEGYRDTSPGVGNEVHVFDPAKAKVLRVLPLARAIAVSNQDYCLSSGVKRSSWKLRGLGLPPSRWRFLRIIDTLARPA